MLSNFLMSKGYLRISFFTVLAAACTALSGYGQNHVSGQGGYFLLEDQIKEKFDLNTANVQDLDLPLQEWTHVTVRTALGGKDYTLSLSPYSVRSWDFKLLVQGADGMLRETEPEPPRTYSGEVLEAPGSMVAASIIDGRMTAAVQLNPQELWFVQPLFDQVLDTPRSAHVVYSAAHGSGGNWTCGTDERHSGHDDCNGCQSAPTSGGKAALGTGFKICEIAYDTDVEYYQKNGSSVASTMHDIEKVTNSLRVIYERDVDITYEVTVIIVRTAEPDPYTSTDSSTLLDQFRNHWNGTKGSVKRDTAHLMTGKNLNGGVIGVAWVGVICNKNLGYGLSESKFSGNFNNRVTLTAHEVGHNWNAGHCSGSTCHIMCATLGGCGGIGLPNFGPTSINSITNFKNSRTCLDDQGDPQVLPFTDNFPSTTLNTDKWSHKNGAQINANAVNEPTPPNSLNLDASGSAEFAEDEIRSNFIRLSGQVDVEVSYHTQHRGVENGEELVVEYWNDNLTWKELNRITSNGVDQNNFVSHSHVMPIDAYHDEFRLRFRTEVNATDDDWYIDNVEVTAGMLPDPPILSSITPKAGIEGGFTAVTLTGQNFTLIPPMTVTFGGNLAGFVNVVNANTITCFTPTGNNGWVDVEVSSAAGSGALTNGYRYFPILGDPFNATDIMTDSVDAPEDLNLIFSGVSKNPFTAYLSFGGGPTPTSFGTMGLDFPIILLLSSNLNIQGFALVPITLPQGFGPLDIYIHALGFKSGGDIVWSTGGNNPNGSGSIWIHLNN